jgi:putative RecB family exonuclease
MAEYSISQLHQFEECALQYKFIYVDRIKRYEEGVEAFLGQRFHEAMEWLYRERAFRVVPLEELLSFYEKAWADKWKAEVKINKEGRTADDYRVMGRRLIEDYYRRHHPFDEGRVLGLEKYIRFPLDDSRRYNCKGIIDRLVLAPDGAFEIHDYKTGSSLPAQVEVDADDQLALYQVGVQTLWPEAKRVRLVWHYVAFDMEMRSSRTPEALEKLRADLAGLIDRIEAEREFPPRESALCGWCAYHDLCPGKKHPAKIESLPGDTWKDEPGVVIVDAYAERWRKKKALEEEIKGPQTEIKSLEAEIKAIREAALDFARQEDVHVIAGTDARLRITSKDTKKWPEIGTAEREALEKELREAGIWNEVARVEEAALEKALAEGKWPDDVLARIKEYRKTEKCFTVTLRDKKKKIKE